MHFKPRGRPKSTSALFLAGEVKNCEKVMTDRCKKVPTRGRGVSKIAKTNADVPYGRPPSSL